jgi:hypothetical protein
LASKDLKIEANISPFALGDVGGQQISSPRKCEGLIEKPFDSEERCVEGTQ